MLDLLCMRGLSVIELLQILITRFLNSNIELNKIIHEKLPPPDDVFVLYQHLVFELLQQVDGKLEMIVAVTKPLEPSLRIHLFHQNYM